MPDTSSIVKSDIVCSANGAASLRLARTTNSPNWFSTAIHLLVTLMKRQGASNEKINSINSNIFKQIPRFWCFKKVNKKC